MGESVSRDHFSLPLRFSFTFLVLFLNLHLRNDKRFFLVHRERAYDKASSMEAHIGYPKELLDDTKLTELYTGVSPIILFSLPQGFYKSYTEWVLF